MRHHDAQLPVCVYVCVYVCVCVCVCIRCIRDYFTFSARDRTCGCKSSRGELRVRVNPRSNFYRIAGHLFGFGLIVHLIGCVAALDVILYSIDRTYYLQGYMGLMPLAVGILELLIQLRSFVT